MFNQYECDSTSHLVLDDTVYTLSWYGEVMPNLCPVRFSVRRGDQLCYKSIKFFTPAYLGDFKVIVKNSTFEEVSRLKLRKTGIKPRKKRTYYLSWNILVCKQI